MRTTSERWEAWVIDRFGLIECSLAVLAGIARDAAARPHEVGGVLFGTRTQTGLRITAFRAVPSEYAAGPCSTSSEPGGSNFQYVLTAAADDPMLRDLVPLGWYHWHTLEGLCLSDADLTLYDRWFPQPWQIALLLRPEHAQPARAAMFCREPGGTPSKVSMCLEFRIAQSPPAQEYSYDERAAQAPAAPHHGRQPLLWICLLLCALLMAPLLMWRKSGPEGRSIGLRVREAQGLLFIEWDRQSPLVKEAASGYLEIVDGPQQAHIDVGRLELLKGSIAFSRSSENMFIRLVLDRPGAAPVEASVNFIGPPVPAGAAGIPIPPALPEFPEIAPAPVVQPSTPPKSRPQPPVRAFRPLVVDAAAAADHSPPSLDAPPPIASRLSANLVPFSGLEPEAVPAPLPAPGRSQFRPAAGQIIWTGSLAPRGVIEIDGREASAGHVTGALPGRPVRIAVFPGELSARGLRLYTTSAAGANHAEDAGPQNGWNPTEYVWDPKRAADITVLEPPTEQNGWKRLAVRSDKRAYSVLLVRWDAAQR